MKTLKKISILAPVFVCGLVAVHHAIWYSHDLADYAFNMTIVGLAACIFVVVVES